MDFKILIDNANDLATKNDLDGAVEKFLEIQNILKNNDDEIWFLQQTYFYLGSLYEQIGYHDKAIETYKAGMNSRFDLFSIYACTLNLAAIVKDRNNVEEAINLYKTIRRKESSELIYAYAQIELGNIYAKTSNVKALKYFYKVKIGDDLKTYTDAQYKISMLSNDIQECLDALDCIPEYSDFYSYAKYYSKIFKKINGLEDLNNKSIILKFAQNISDIMEELFISSDYEKSIAHYTNLTVSKLLLATSRNYSSGIYEQKSYLRLNTINLMNDPEEGLLVNDLLYLNNKIKTQDLAFISCFTLHHDSLNQFRLYSKEFQQEAFGVSLILGKNFFAKKHDTSSLYKDTKEGLDINLKNKESSLSSGITELPLYRCIYFDPTSGLMKVAQREEWSFRREFKLKNKCKWFDSNEGADRKWEDYKMKIDSIENSIKIKMKNLTNFIEYLNTKEMDSYSGKLLAEILLPLRYLIKNMAFKEEQECRIVYVTQMDNPLIQYDEKINRIYIDYAPSVMEHLEKIYIAPKAKDEKMVFEYLCSRGQEIRKGKEAVKVKISQNPFR